MVVACSLPDIQGPPWTPSNTAVGQRHPHVLCHQAARLCPRLVTALLPEREQADNGADRFALATPGATPHRAVEADPLVAPRYT
jgi:hypothetical protein